MRDVSKVYLNLFLQITIVALVFSVFTARSGICFRANSGAPLLHGLGSWLHSPTRIAITKSILQRGNTCRGMLQACPCAVILDWDTHAHTHAHMWMDTHTHTHTHTHTQGERMHTFNSRLPTSMKINVSWFFFHLFANLFSGWSRCFGFHAYEVGHLCACVGVCVNFSSYHVQVLVGVCAFT